MTKEEIEKRMSGIQAKITEHKTFQQEYKIVDRFEPPYSDNDKMQYQAIAAKYKDELEKMQKEFPQETMGTCLHAKLNNRDSEAAMALPKLQGELDTLQKQLDGINQTSFKP